MWITRHTHLSFVTLLTAVAIALALYGPTLSTSAADKLPAPLSKYKGRLPHLGLGRHQTDPYRSQKSTSIDLGTGPRRFDSPKSRTLQCLHSSQFLSLSNTLSNYCFDLLRLIFDPHFIK